MALRYAIAFVIIVIVGSRADPARAEQAEEASANSAGSKLFSAHCARCHGMGGTGGEGPSLNRRVLPRVADDEAFAAIIRDGIEGTEMPGTWMLSDAEIGRVVQYVRSLGETPSETLDGDPARGRRLFEGRGGCTVCHIVAGAGGVLGPALSDIGARRGARHLRESLLSPGAVVAPKYVVVRAVTKDDREIVGVRVNEDSFTVQIRDAGGSYHSLTKRELIAFEKKLGESLMMSYERDLAPTEIEDVVAYLSSLKGEW